MTLRELEQAATPAPWTDENGHPFVYMTPADIAFTAALRNAAPLLLDVADAARAVDVAKGAAAYLTARARLHDALAALDAAT